MLKDLFISMRPKQWYKNFVIFIAIIFSFNFFNFELWFEVILSFIIFCMVSGVVYLINDIVDIEEDKLHPKKKSRPIASGKLKKSSVIIAIILFLSLSIILSLQISIVFLLTVLTFLFLNFTYTFYLKNFVLVDIIIISTGFVLRAAAGAIAIDVRISPWLIICVFLLALFLSLSKRRHELVLMGDESKDHRAILEFYEKDMLDQMIGIATASLIIAYLFYTFMVGNGWIMITIPVVIYAIFRYLFLINTKNFGGEPQMLFRDKGMLISIALWVILVILVLYDIPEVFANFFEIGLPRIFN